MPSRDISAAVGEGGRARSPAVDASPASRLLVEDVRRRLDLCLASGRRLLGEPHRAPSDDAVAHLGEVSDLVERLVERIDAEEGTSAAAAEQSRHLDQLARERDRYRARVAAVADVEDALERLREITSPAAMLATAPERLCASAGFDRALISTIEGGHLRPTALHFRDDPDGARAALDALRTEPIRLAHPLIEMEVLRRRRATVVPDASLNPRVHPHLATVMGWGSYVAAPVNEGSGTIALIHADRRTRPIDVVQRDNLWEFAVGLAQAHESALLRRRLRHEREQLSRFLEQLRVRLGELSDATIELAPPSRTPTPDAPRGELWDSTEHGARGSLDGALTRRELDVLKLLSEGLSNRAIAARLVVSQGTVKFHVNNILRKLRATNRAEAVSRYLSL